MLAGCGTAKGASTGSSHPPSGSPPNITAAVAASVSARSIDFQVQPVSSGIAATTNGSAPSSGNPTGAGAYDLQSRSGLVNIAQSAAGSSQGSGTQGAPGGSSAQIVFAPATLFISAASVSSTSTSTSTQTPAKPWVSIDQSEFGQLMQAKPNVMDPLGALDPSVYFDALSGVTGTPAFDRLTVVGNAFSTGYKVTSNLSKVSASATGIEALVLAKMAADLGSSPLSMEVWIGQSDGRIWGIDLLSPLPGFSPNSLVINRYGIPFTIALPTADQTVDYSTLNPALPAAGSSTSTTTADAGGATQPETCAEDQADGGNDASGKCTPSASTPTTAPPTTIAGSSGGPNSGIPIPSQ